jgi:hypothetical protein
MKVKIFEKTWTSGLGTLEREINNFLATLPPGAVLNTQTTMAAARNDSDQTVTEYLVAIWYDDEAANWDGLECENSEDECPDQQREAQCDNG